MSKPRKGLNVKILFNPFGVVKKPYICLPELHSRLFMFNPFGILKFVGNGQCLKYPKRTPQYKRDFEALFPFKNPNSNEKPPSDVALARSAMPTVTPLKRQANRVCQLPYRGGGGHKIRRMPFYRHTLPNKLCRD